MMRPSISTGTYEEMIAPTPPSANLDSQLIRVWVSDPSSLSNRPEMFDRKMRFFTVRLRNFSGVKISSNTSARSRGGAPDAFQQREHPGVGGTPAPALRHEGQLGGWRALVRGAELQQHQGRRVEIPGERLAADT